MIEHDIFICHASEDKQEIVRPLAAALEKEGIKCWVDEGEIKWGDSITQKVNEGIRVSRFFIVVLSEAFPGKNWPERELYAILNLEATLGDVKVLPLLVGDKSVRQSILAEFPLLNDKRYETWDGTPDPVVNAALIRLSRQHKTNSIPVMSEEDGLSEGEIPLPKMRKRFSQRDKDLFLKEAFKVIKDYFQHALSRLETQYSDVETDFTEINTHKFIAKIYFKGEIKNRCKIWIGGLSASNEIAYSENSISIDADNSFNELLSVEDDDFELKLRFTIGIMYQQQEKGLHDPQEAAELLWIRFSSPLERI